MSFEAKKRAAVLSRDNLTRERITPAIALGVCQRTGARFEPHQAALAADKATVVHYQYAAFEYLFGHAAFANLARHYVAKSGLMPISG